jgi:hypothetical protein
VRAGGRAGVPAPHARPAPLPRRARHRTTGAPRAVLGRRAAPGARRARRAGRTLRALDLAFDDLAIVLAIGPSRGGGLRGGAYDVRSGRLRLRSYEYVPGIAISARPLGSEGGLRVTFSGPAAARGTVAVTPLGTVRGRLGGRRVAATLRAGPPAI